MKTIGLAAGALVFFLIGLLIGMQVGKGGDLHKDPEPRGDGTLTVEFMNEGRSVALHAQQGNKVSVTGLASNGCLPESVKEEGKQFVVVMVK